VPAPTDIDLTDDTSRGEDRRVKRALITGITGQDGSHLAELLLEKATRCTA
jgi:hypothetical protein